MPISNYKQVYIDIKKQIVSGIYNKGDVIPSENELCAMYNMARATIRKAMDLLASEGYISRHPGRGSIVTSNQKKLGLLSFKGFTESIGKERVSTKIMKGPVLQRFSTDFFYTLSSVEQSAGHIYLERIRFVDEIPVMHEKTYIPNLNLPGLCSDTFVEGSLFRTLQKKYTVDIVNVDQDLKAMPVPESSQGLLKMKPNQAALQISRRYSTSRKELYIYSMLICNTTQYSIGNTFK